MRRGAPEPPDRSHIPASRASEVRPARPRRAGAMPSDRPFKQRRSFGEAQWAICERRVAAWGLGVLAGETRLPQVTSAP